MDQIIRKKRNRNDAKFEKILSDMLNNQDKIIQLNKQGFTILKLSKFKSEVLPQYFKHNKYESFLRQLNKYGYKTTIKEKDLVQFTLSSQLDKNNQNLNNQKAQIQVRDVDFEQDLDLMKIRLINLQEDQNIFMKQMNLSIQLMNLVTKQFQKFTQTTMQTVNYCKDFSSLVQRNLQKAWPNSLGEIQQSQLRAAKLAYPEYFSDIQLFTPVPSYLTTPQPFYNYTNKELEPKQ